MNFILLSGCQNRPLYRETRVMMGTFVEVISSDPRAAGIVFKEIQRVEGLLSKYKEESEISRLNKAGRLAVSPETKYILQKAKEFWELSAGAFDITVGSLVDIWGFTDRKYRVPDKEVIQDALALVGGDKIIWSQDDNVVQFKNPGIKIDLGAIAKGYATDCAVKKLKENGINSALVRAGGNIYCLGDNFGRPWKVAIKHPRKKGILKIQKIKDRAVDTSGDYEQYFIRGGKRYSHIINPITGYPVESGVISVTVEASDCLTADALATSIFVLGKDKGEALAKKFPGAQVRIITDKETLN